MKRVWQRILFRTSYTQCTSDLQCVAHKGDHSDHCHLAGHQATPLILLASSTIKSAKLASTPTSTATPPSPPSLVTQYHDLTWVSVGTTFADHCPLALIPA